MSEEHSELHRWLTTFHAIFSSPPDTPVTPRSEVWKKNKAVLWHYKPQVRKYRTPLFLVYSLVNQPVILDLMPGDSLIGSFVNEGFDVYLLDFGKPGFEDRNISFSDYIVDYIERGMKRALSHSGSGELTVIGYCLGGTMAAIAAAYTKLPVSNLILSSAPIDYHAFPLFDQWLEYVQESNADTKTKELFGTIPASFIEFGMRLLASPLYFTHYLSLLSKAHHPQYVEKWRRFNSWTKGHIPFTGAANDQIFEDLLKNNALIKDTLIIRGRSVKLSDITCSLLVSVVQHDKLVPQEIADVIMERVNSPDKQLVEIKGGHAAHSYKAGIPPFLKDWLEPRSKGGM
ncbi:alpha/beta fold hydrolase [Bacillus lacus]|uniref:Alpha/beta fold hydrolase n=1 Tax=Metabacillus lacus TaxID=1983721 RepID=A0A7X2LZ56_9BACI|nr:alpha/beta fold hydrolase [Metabacillus lacus]MRX71587.1 alpha/beta fold hydrolase [Metabacillus lacus]